MKRDKIRKLWPLMAAHQDQDDNVRKYEAEQGEIHQYLESGGVALS